MSERRFRNPSLSVVYNFIAPGLGFLYLGKPLWALCIPLIFLLLEGLVSWTGLIFHPAVFYAFRAVTFLFAAGILIASWRMAKRLGFVQLARSQRWQFYVAFLLVFLFGKQFVDDHRIEIFRYAILDVSSDSIDPSLVRGDQVLAEVLPLESGALKRGNLLYVNYRHGRPEWKRVVGLPEDSLEFEGQNLRVNGKPCDDPALASFDLFKKYPFQLWATRVSQDGMFVLGKSDYVSISWTNYSGGKNTAEFPIGTLREARLKFVCISWSSRSTIRPWRNGETLDLPPLLYLP